MSTHNIGFYEDLTKIIFELSSNTHFNSSAVKKLFVCLAALISCFFSWTHDHSTCIHRNYSP